MINRFYDKRYQVEPFGSTCYGVDSATSDLDLVITVRPLFPSPFQSVTVHRIRPGAQDSKISILLQEARKRTLVS